jgi:hypothetical protein
VYIFLGRCGRHCDCVLGMSRAAVVGEGPGFRFRTFGSGLRRQETAADWGPAEGR